MFNNIDEPWRNDQNHHQSRVWGEEKQLLGRRLRPLPFLFGVFSWQPISAWWKGTRQRGRADQAQALDVQAHMKHGSYGSKDEYWLHCEGCPQVEVEPEENCLEVRCFVLSRAAGYGFGGGAASVLTPPKSNSTTHLKVKPRWRKISYVYRFLFWSVRYFHLSITLLNVTRNRAINIHPVSASITVRYS